MSKVLLNCACGAKYDPAVGWAYGRFIGTSDQFVRYGAVKPGHCPVCRRPPITTRAA